MSAAGSRSAGDNERTVAPRAAATSVTPHSRLSRSDDSRLGSVFHRARPRLRLARRLSLARFVYRADEVMMTATLLQSQR